MTSSFYYLHGCFSFTDECSWQKIREMFEIEDSHNINKNMQTCHFTVKLMKERKTETKVRCLTSGLWRP